jgi:hypothetical protein
MICPKRAKVLQDHLDNGFFCLVLDSDGMVVERGVNCIIASGNMEQATALGQHEVSGLVLLSKIADTKCGLEATRDQFHKLCETNFTNLDVNYMYEFWKVTDAIHRKE